MECLKKAGMDGSVISRTYEELSRRSSEEGNMQKVQAPFPKVWTEIVCNILRKVLVDVTIVFDINGEHIMCQEFDSGIFTLSVLVLSFLLEYLWYFQVFLQF